MADFPTIACKPQISSWEEQVAQDPTIRNPTSGGYVQTRPAFTRLIDKWHVLYPTLSDTEKGTLRTFEHTVKVGSDSFNWTNPKTSAAKVVRFLAPIKYRLGGSGIYWIAEFDLEEV